jgi:hypothetical protein
MKECVHRKEMIMFLNCGPQTVFLSLCSPHKSLSLTCLPERNHLCTLNLVLKHQDHGIFGKIESIFRFLFQLSVYQVRQLSGCLIRVPQNFYEDIW